MLLSYVHDDPSFVLQKAQLLLRVLMRAKTLALLAEKCEADKQGRDEAQQSEVESSKLIALVNFTAKQ